MDLRRVAMLAAIMTATLFLSFVVLVIGFIAADGLHRLCFVFGRAWPSVAILSFGGIPRQRAHKGGLLLVFSSVLVLLPLSVVGAWPSGAGASMMLIGVAVLGRLREGAPHLVSRQCAQLTLIVIALFVPDAWLVWWPVAAIVAHRCWIACEAQDQVAGILTSLYAPLLIGSGLLLVLVHANWDGLFALVAAGCWVGVHALHRFPPHLIGGRSGLLALAFVKLVTIGALISAQAWLALGILWSFPLVLLAADLAQSGRAHVPPFAMARQRGEPILGLLAAAASLSCTKAILVWSTLAQPFALRLGALGLSLFLAWQFVRFLTYGAQASVTRAQAHAVPRRHGPAATERR